MKMHKSKKILAKGSDTVLDIVVVTILTFIALIIFFPFYNTVISSIQTSRAYVLNPVALWPKEVTLSAYKRLFDSGMIWNGYKATLKVTILGTIYGMSVSTMAAYAFSRSEFPGKKFFFVLFLITMFFSGGMVPMYLQIKNMGLLDTHIVLILMGGVSMYNIIIMKNSFEQMPVELEEVAKIDGANDLVIFLKVMLPLQTPVLATFTLFTMVGYWNEWFWATMVINTSSKMTLQTVLRLVVNKSLSVGESSSGDAMQPTFSQGIKTAAIVATMLPIMCVYPFLQKYFVKGITVGSIKM